MQRESLSRVEKFTSEFELAFSFTELMRDTARDLWCVAEHVGIRSYFYTEELVRQSGIRIERLTEAIYVHLDSVIVDSSNYGKTKATQSELAAIRTRLSENSNAKTILVRYAEPSGTSNVLSEYVAIGSPQVILVEANQSLTKTRERFASVLNAVIQ